MANHCRVVHAEYTLACLRRGKPVLCEKTLAVRAEDAAHIVESGAETVVSGDMGCLMHLGGLMKRQGLAIKTQHYVELLAEAIS